MKTFYLTLLLFSSWFVSANQGVYVSPKGKTSGDGTIKHPFQSIQQAVDFASNLPFNHDVEIFLRGGTYSVTRTIEIHPENWKNRRMIIKPYNNEKVSISGGKSILLSNAKKVTDPIAISRIQKECLSKIKVIDLKKESVTAADLMPVGFGRPSLPAWTELFVDGKPMKLSRWPNDSEQLIGKIYNEGNIPREKNYTKGKAEFGYDNPRPARWTKAPQVWIAGYFAYGYADDMVRVEAIDTIKKSFTIGDDSLYGFKTGAPYRNWHAINLLEEIDVPGEYVLDEKNGKIYFYPPTDKMSRIDISLLEGPLMAIEKTGNITIEDLTFEYTRGMGVYMEETENVIVKGCTFRNIGNVAVCIGKGDMTPASKDAALGVVSNQIRKDSSRILGTLNSRFYDDTLYDRNGGKNNGIVNCSIYNVGAGGVSLGGGNRATLTPAGNYVDNCRIHDYNRINRSYHGAINMDGVGNRISHCEIFNAPSMAILFHGNNHLIEYCDISKVCNEIDDQGAVYYGRDVSERGNLIRYCYFHDFDSKHRVTATYHDDGACDMRVEGCIYYKAGTIPVLIGGGNDNQYVNNIFMDSPIAIHIDNRLKGWYASGIARGGILDQRLQTVHFSEPPYSTQYPLIVNYWNETPGKPKRNVFEQNLFYKVGKVLAGKTEWGEFKNNWNPTDEEPGFVDEKNPLKGFKSNAKVFEKIPGFKEIPFDKIGCSLPK